MNCALHTDSPCSCGSSATALSVSNVVSASRRTLPCSSSSSAPAACAPAPAAADATRRVHSTANVRLASWYAMRRGCSPSGMVRMCSFWMSSMVPIVSADLEASASDSGKEALLKQHMCVTPRGRFTLLNISLRLAP